MYCSDQFISFLLISDLIACILTIVVTKRNIFVIASIALKVEIGLIEEYWSYQIEHTTADLNAL
ncbi:hypothetical protein CAAN1_02S07976 [[Candida] anglica]|uniref:Uncharacterized protein n=1 Tax=[Candida] anglica TaxID=148631 RepID=A0ABP0EGB4_9ASCO